MYNGMTAENAEGVEILFNHAEVRICVEYIGPQTHETPKNAEIFFYVAHPYYPELSKEAKSITHNTEKLGRRSATHYNCDNYTSPIHCDHDATRGTCAQYTLPNRMDEYDEYSFVYGAYGIYIVTRVGCFWFIFTQLFEDPFLIEIFGRTFNGNEPHGSILPANHPLRLRGGSTGDHQTHRLRDITAATAMHEARRTRAQRYEHWNNLRQYSCCS